MDYLITLIGFVLIFLGGQYLVKSAANLSALLRLPKMVVGILVVGIGTSIPELAISVVSLSHGHTHLLVGNVLGSNIANVLLVLGAAACVRSFAMISNQSKTNISLLLSSAGLLLLGFLFANIAHWIAALMTLVLIVGVISLCRKRHTETPDTTTTNPNGFLMEILILVLAILALVFGAKFIVEGAVNIAQSIGISQLMIGLTLVAIGTSLPELVFSVIAAKQNHPDLVIGNVVGSNIFNILLGLGIPGLFWPIRMNWHSEFFSILVFTLTTLLLCAALAFKSKLSRRVGIVALGCYVAFLAVIVYLN